MLATLECVPTMFDCPAKIKTRSGSGCACTELGGAIAMPISKQHWMKLVGGIFSSCRKTTDMWRKREKPDWKAMFLIDSGVQPNNLGWQT